MLIKPRELSEVEESILKLLAAQGSARLTPQAIVEHVGCRLSTLYELLQDDYFQSLWVSALQKTTAAVAPEVLNSFEAEARRGSFRHGKLILEIAGVYTPKSQTELKGNIQVDDNPFTTPEERRNFLSRLVSKLNEIQDDPE